MVPITNLNCIKFKVLLYYDNNSITIEISTIIIEIILHYFYCYNIMM